MTSRDIESNNDALVITLAITMHGCVTTMDIDPDNNYNVRYTSLTNDDLNSGAISPEGTSKGVHALMRYFRKDTPSGHEGEILNNLSYFDSLPYDKAFSSKGRPDPIGFTNKVVTGVKDGAQAGFEAGCSIFELLVWAGIWVISVHERRKPQPINDYKYLYPKEIDHYSNLLNLNGLERLNQSFNKIPNLKRSLIMDEQNNKLSNLSHIIKLNNDNTRIEKIQLSYLLNLLRQIMGPKCEFNIYD